MFVDGCWLRVATREKIALPVKPEKYSTGRLATAPGTVVPLRCNHADWTDASSLTELTLAQWADDPGLKVLLLRAPRGILTYPWSFRRSGWYNYDPLSHTNQSVYKTWRNLLTRTHSGSTPLCQR